MKWERIKLEDCCISITDGDHQPPPKAETGIPFVTISNITSTNQFDFSETLFVPQDYYDKLDEKRKARRDDILYSVVGSFGIPVFMKEEKDFVFQRHIAILRPDSEIIVPRFLFYTMLTKDFYAKADAAALGAAQRTVSLTSLRNIEICIPDKILQSKIVDTLSVYDDLIDNNQKQIKLLEEAAQRLYKEWFVDLRFPGYEDTKIVDGVPEGWKKGCLSEIVEFKRGKTITKKQVLEGIIPVVAGGLEPAYYHNKANTDSPVITISGSGANAGFCRMYFEDVFASDCSFADIQGTKNLFFVYCFLKANKYQLDALQKGSAQPHVYAKDINVMEICIPDKKVMNCFCEMVTPNFNKMGILQKQNVVIAEARDRLLPKLMSGEIEL